MSVVVGVDDRGGGIPEEIRARIFDPFFSTKGEGTGLGLAITRHIVEAHGGAITCEPREGGGTRFRIALPIAPSKSTRLPVERLNGCGAPRRIATERGPQRRHERQGWDWVCPRCERLAGARRPVSPRGKPTSSWRSWRPGGPPFCGGQRVVSRERRAVYSAHASSRWTRARRTSTGRDDRRVPPARPRARCSTAPAATVVLCTASVDEKVPPFLEGKGKGWITAEYQMHPRANPERRETATGAARRRAGARRRSSGSSGARSARRSTSTSSASAPSPSTATCSRPTAARAPRRSPAASSRSRWPARRR